jgi:transposase
MPKTYQVTKENSQDLRIAMDKKENEKHYKKLLSVALRGEGKDNDEIASIIGFHPGHVSKLVSNFCNKGINALLRDDRGGPNRCNMTDEEEKAFLAGFEEAAKTGQLTTISEIAAAYDKVTGKKHESKSTVYYLLHKHGWRIVAPQTTHPGKASDEVIETSKKLTLSLRK